MDSAQQQEMDEQFRRTNCKHTHFCLRGDSGKLLGTSGPPRASSGVQYPNILPIPLIYETRMSTKCSTYLGAADSDLLQGLRRKTFKTVLPMPISAGHDIFTNVALQLHHIPI